MALTKAHPRMIEGVTISVKDFGATGDGSTDDTAAIQSAIDFFDGTNGGVLFFPAGTYVVSDQLIIPIKDASYRVPILFRGETVDLAGYSSTTINYTKTSGACFQARGSAGTDTRRFTGGFENLNINGPGTSDTADGIVVYFATGMVISRCVIQNFRHGFNPELYFYYSQIHDCRFNNCVYGIYSNSCAWNGASVFNSRFTSCTHLVYLRFFGTNVNFTACTFESSTSTMLRLDSGLQASINQCYFEGSSQAIQFGPDTTTANNNCALSIIDSYFEINATVSTRIVNVPMTNNNLNVRVNILGVQCGIASASTITHFLSSTYGSVLVCAPNGITNRTSTGFKSIALSQNATEYAVSGTVSLSPSVTIRAGSGSPEGSVTGNIGSLWSRTDGSTGTSLYVKESGTGNTGWVAK